MGAEVLAFHLEGLAADGAVAPNRLEDIIKDAKSRDNVVVLVATPAVAG